MVSLRKKVISGVIWRFAEQFGTQLISFVVSIILARLLGPEEFGTVALLSIFLALSQRLVGGGLSGSLVQKKNVDELDFNSVFYFNVLCAVVLYAILWMCSPLIAGFYDKPILVLVLRISALKILLDSISEVQNAVIIRDMRFNLSFWITLSGTIVSGVVGIWMAYSGYGLWSLVFSVLSGSLVSTVVRWFLVDWRPLWRFSFSRLRELFAFGSYMLSSALLASFAEQVPSLVIGKMYETSALAYFNRGERMPSMVMNSIQAAIGSAILPALCTVQDDRSRMKNIMKKAIQTSSFFVFPLMLGLAAISEPLILILLTSKWLPAVPFMQLACIGCAFWPFQVTNLQAIHASGRGNVFLKVELFKQVSSIAVLLITFHFGVMAIAIGRVLATPLGLIINAYPNAKWVDYGFFAQIRDISKIIILSLIMAIGVWFGSQCFQPGIGTLVGLTVAGAVSYFVGSILLKIEPASQILNRVYQGFKK